MVQFCLVPSLSPRFFTFLRAPLSRFFHLSPRSVVALIKMPPGTECLVDEPLLRRERLLDEIARHLAVETRTELVAQRLHDGADLSHARRDLRRDRGLDLVRA